MDLERLYYEIKNYLDMVDFSRLWRGFEPLKFALYTDKECFFDGAYIPKTEAFLANTSIFYQGEWIAIWNVQEYTNPVVLTSKIVHEMFHGFQMMHKDCRFPDEMEALYQYRYDEENLNLKMREYQLIYQLSADFDRELFEELLQRRKYRRNSFGYAYHYEAGIEQIEGTANFVELHCLKQLSSQRFERKLSEMRERILAPKNLFPIRVICYDIGALLLHILTENNLDFDDGFSPEPFSETLLRDVTEIKFVSDCSTKALLDSYNAKAAEMIREAKEKNTLVADIPCDLLGVNVYNAVFFDNHIISTYFVMFETDGQQQVEYGDFVIETNACRKAQKIYRL